MKHKVPGTVDPPQLQPHRFSQSASQTVADHRFSKSLGNREAGPRWPFPAAIQMEHCETGAGQPRSFVVNPPEFLALQKPAGFWEDRGRHLGTQKITLR